MAFDRTMLSSVHGSVSIVMYFQYSKTKGNEIFGTHETPKKHYIDDLSFTLTDNGNRCTVDVCSIPTSLCCVVALMY